MSPMIRPLRLLLSAAALGQLSLSVALSTPTQSGLEQVVSVLHRVQDSNAQATHKLSDNHDALQEACEVVGSRSKQLVKLGKLLQTRLASDEKEQHSLFLSSKSATVALRARLALLERGEAEAHGDPKLALNSALRRRALRDELESEEPMASYREERRAEAAQRVQDQSTSTSALAALAQAYASSCQSALRGAEELLRRGEKQEGGLTEVLKSVQSLAPPSQDALSADSSAANADEDLQASDFTSVDDSEVAAFIQVSASHNATDVPPSADAESSEDSDLLSLFKGGDSSSSSSSSSSSLPSEAQEVEAEAQAEAQAHADDDGSSSQENIQELASSLDADASAASAAASSTGGSREAPSSSASASLMQKAQQLLEAAEAENVSSFSSSSEWCGEERAASKLSLRSAATSARAEGARAKDLEEAVQQIGEDLDRINATAKFVHDASQRLSLLLEAQQKLVASAERDEGLADRILKEALRILAQSPHQPGRESALIAMQNAIDTFSKRHPTSPSPSRDAAPALSDARRAAVDALENERTNLQASREQHLLDIDRSYDQKRLFDLDLKSKVEFLQSLENNCRHRSMPEAQKERKVEIRALSDAEDVLSGRALRGSPTAASPSASVSAFSSEASSSEGSASAPLELEPLDSDSDSDANSKSEPDLDSEAPKKKGAAAASMAGRTTDSSDSLQDLAASLGIDDGN